MPEWFENGTNDLVPAWFCYGLKCWHDAGMKQFLLTTFSFVNKWSNHIVLALFHCVISLGVVPPSNPTGKGSILVSYREPFRFHFVQFSSDFHAVIVWTGGLSAIVLFSFQIILASCERGLNNTCGGDFWDNAEDISETIQSNKYVEIRHNLCSIDGSWIPEIP